MRGIDYMLTNSVLKMPERISTSAFYESILPQVYESLAHKEKDVLFDFSDVTRINSLAIPDLLCMGLLLRISNDKLPVIYIPETMGKENLKSYLYQIGFTRLAKEQKMFDFYYSPTAGMEGVEMDPLCTSFFFSADDSKDYIARKVSFYVNEFAKKYLKEFSYRDINVDENGEPYIVYKNAIVDFLSQLLENCSIHSSSFSIATLHANYKEKKIYISVSDMGRGFLHTPYNYGCISEYEAIMRSVYKRKDETLYGLYNVIEKVMMHAGLVRIHSNNTRVVFSSPWKGEYTENNLLNNQNFRKYNVTKNVNFSGAHVEIELPFNGDLRDV